jgi:hypothetical protein
MKNKKKENSLIIDVVFTWVDSNDENHFKKIAKYRNEILNNKKFLTRYNSINEIEYAVNSVLKYASFIRNIYIVTDNQTPKFLLKDNKKYDKVKIIDHTELFKENNNYLPTFNSISIESMLYNIPNLSEHFIYFNDDFFLVNNTTISDFFIEGKPVIRGKWEVFDSDKIIRSVYKKILKELKLYSKEDKHGYKKSQQNAARLLKFTKYLKINHTPTPMRKSVIKSFLEKNNDILLKNIKYKFRHPSQFMIQSLSNHLDILNDEYVLIKEHRLLFFRTCKYSLSKIENKLNLIDQKNILFLCIQSMDLCSEKKLNFLLQWLNKRILN